MGKQTGLGDQLYIGGYDIGSDIQGIGSLSTPRAVLEMTGITKSAFERAYAHTDAQGEFTSYFNDADDQILAALKGLPRTDVSLMYLRGSGLGEQAFCTVAKQLNYDGNRGDDGSLLFSTTVQGSAYGADWGVQLTAGKETDASAGSGTGVELEGAASVSFGFQAYLQVFSLGSGTANIKIQHSQDDAATDAYADLTGGAFTAVTGRTAQRIASASETLAVEKYVRVVTSGTFTDLVFAVAFNRNLALRAVS